MGGGGMELIAVDGYTNLFTPFKKYLYLKCMKENHNYVNFCSKQILQTKLNTLLGIIEGINIDSFVCIKELKEFKEWTTDAFDYKNNAPFNDIISRVDEINLDNCQEVFEDLTWFCKKALSENEFYDHTTQEIQHLSGILHGIIANSEINDLEIINLHKWLSMNEHLLGTYPYDSLSELLNHILEDGIIDENERSFLKSFFNAFCNPSLSYKIEQALTNSEPENFTKLYEKYSIFEDDPQIIFKDNTFCVTGISAKYKRSEIFEMIEQRGGIVSKNMTKDTDYLIYCNEGNTCWAFSTWGRKVERAINYKKKDSRIHIIKEDDLLRTILDAEDLLFNDFHWPIPYAFKDALNSCDFKKGDIIHNFKDAYTKDWGDAINSKAISFSILDAEKKDKKTKSINWLNKVTIEKIEHKSGKKSVFETYQGNLYMAAYTGNESLLYKKKAPDYLNDEKLLLRNLENLSISKLAKAQLISVKELTNDIPGV